MRWVSDTVATRACALRPQAGRGGWARLAARLEAASQSSSGARRAKFTVLVAGGSMTAGANCRLSTGEVAYNKVTCSWPATFAHMVGAAFPGVELDVVNLAIGGYGSESALPLLPVYLREVPVGLMRVSPTARPYKRTLNPACPVLL